MTGHERKSKTCRCGRRIQVPHRALATEHWACELCRFGIHHASVIRHVRAMGRATGRHLLQQGKVPRD